MEAAAAAAAAAGEGRKRGRVKDAGGGGEAEAEAHKRRAALAVVPWAQQHPASRIYRVSRASGGKDRHSKVYTAKGIRDRRVRLSVATAIQFYDLQDRLGYDQPSKAIEWLIKAAAAAIDKLPSLDTATGATGFPAHPASAKDHPPAPAAADERADDHDGHHHQQLSRSGCSSTSDTSKGSVLSLSRSESRVKARERARERSAAARDKDKDPGADDAPPAATGPTRRAATAASAQTATFTELLTGLANAAPGVANHKPQQQQQPPPAASWRPMPVSTTADYIGFAAAQPRKATAHAFAAPAPHLALAGGNIAAPTIAMAPAAQHFGLSGGAVTIASGGGGGEPHAEMTTHFSFLQDHFMPVHAAPASGPAGDYNLNFSMSSGLVGVNSRGTLQSNSQPHISGHQLQRFSTHLDAPNIHFPFGPAAAVTTPTTADSQLAAFQLWNGFHHADMKHKGKN